jgi:hypothetical protein
MTGNTHLTVSVHNRARSADRSHARWDTQHLTTLRAAGPAVTHRPGRALLNTRTAMAEAPLAATARAVGQSGSTTDVGVPATQVTVIR